MIKTIFTIKNSYHLCTFVCIRVIIQTYLWIKNCKGGKIRDIWRFFVQTHPGLYINMIIKNDFCNYWPYGYSEWTIIEHVFQAFGTPVLKSTYPKDSGVF